MNATKIGKILGILSIAIFILLTLFIGTNTAHLLRAGFTSDNIISGKLPENYITGDGSTFYANDTAIRLGLPITIVLGILAILLIFKAKRQKLNRA